MNLSKDQMVAIETLLATSYDSGYYAGCLMYASNRRKEYEKLSKDAIEIRTQAYANLIKLFNQGETND